MQTINLENIRFDSGGLIPAIIQNYQTKEVLMLAYMNQESLELSLVHRQTWFYSRSRQQLWHKGATSGNHQKIEKISYDCDGDTLLIEVTPSGPACHTGAISCFYRQLAVTSEAESQGNGQKKQPTFEGVINSLYNTIRERKANPVEGSYTNYLFDKGLDKILKKVGEEATEVVIGAKNSSRDELVYELADLIYHLMVLGVVVGVGPEDVGVELKSRFK